MAQLIKQQFMKKILMMNNELTGLIARFKIALILLPHGAQKLLSSKATCWLFAICLLSCTNKGEISTIDRNKKIADLYFNEVWNKGNTNLLDSILAEDYINHTPSVPTVSGPRGLKPIILAIRKGFPDLHYEIKEIIATENYITIRSIMTGTQKDTLFNIPPTGQHIEVNQINIEKIVNGKISEHWRVTDELTLMKQLGKVR
jgi:steroid delta-isomerase-like uncharacterized protein